jgi:hypothetical protein
MEDDDTVNIACPYECLSCGAKAGEPCNPHCFFLAERRREGSDTDFKDALGGDVVVPNAGRAGALDASEALAVRDWWDARRQPKD